ncbi:hypothetical protein QCN29_26925 [Streptomyces sp. HNM0663]|uniref:Uncharacterized protein n=1 Tax=Streptomyces chengmaiensis TaxID=3040919 RepID=A0ABT6HUF0_9ACTN|nr:hypothetical protein [Streptomyces chengmaiensis]MDH2392346.1 hypothetical protein [Streptomyces chengmaiensis]
MTTTIIRLGDDRATTHTVQTVPVDTGTCSHGHDSCGKPGVLAVRNTIDQQRPAESSTMRVTVCAEHLDGAAHMHQAWVASARELQDPAKRAEFLAAAGVR